MGTVEVLLSAFLISFFALIIFIWSMRKGLFEGDTGGGSTIFAANEVGRIEDPSAPAGERKALQAAVDDSAPLASSEASVRDLQLRAEADRSSAGVVFVYFACAIGWLVLASSAGVVASIKLHEPDWLTAYSWLTFGRVRTIHLNAIAYGWTPMAGLGLALWLLPRLLQTPLKGSRIALLGAVLWNAGLIAGIGAIAAGINDGMEWLEIPWQVDILFVIGGALVGIPLILTLLNRKVDHLYVSIWYMGAALFWFPVLFFVANFPGLHFGVEAATMNWWYGHNVLGLFFGPLGLATIYYFLPKVIGRPVQSYNLSLIGFWSLAFFYGQVGGHHLIGGPVPGWMITLSIVQSMMMLIPVIAFAVNYVGTLHGYYSALRYSPTLRFVAVAGIFYVMSSVQGSFEALRAMNTITHFTHYTVGHAHLGVYGFVAFAFFGGMYFVVPRIMDREWPFPKLIAAHFWLAFLGIIIYFVSLSIGGLLQGFAMLDAARPFMDSVAVTIPWLKGRSLGGSMMALSHFIFAAHFVIMAFGVGKELEKPTYFREVGSPAE